MKFCKVCLLALMAITMFACSKDDGPAPQPTPDPDPDPTNNAPKITAQTFTVKESIPEATIIGTVTATDADGDALSFSVTTNDGDLFKITSGGTLSLAAGQKLDFETKTSHSITVSVTDGTDTATAEVKITVEDVFESLADDADAFITTWTTDNDEQTITIYLNEVLDYDFTIEWGDGTIEDYTSSADLEHTYATAGTYTVALKGQFPAIHMGKLDVDIKYLSSIEQWGNNVWRTMEEAFARCTSMEYNATDAPDLSNVTNMSRMFYVALNFNGEIGNWDVSNVQNMSGTFDYATTFNGDIGAWDVSQVTDMSGMFQTASAFNQDLNEWDVSQVTTMENMFNLAIAFNGDISSWDVGQVTDMSEMFDSAGAFNGDLSGWDVSEVTDMYGMFQNAQVFSGDLSQWNVGKVTTMAYMFSHSYNFNSDIGAWDVSQVTDMESMFRFAENFKQDIGDWNVAKVTTMREMFRTAVLFNQSLGNWDISNVTTMDGMLTFTKLSTENYNATLIGWSTLDEGEQKIPQNITLGANGLVYCGFEAIVARGVLEGNGWTLFQDEQCN